LRQQLVAAEWARAVERRAHYCTARSLRRRAACRLAALGSGLRKSAGSVRALMGALSGPRLLELLLRGARIDEDGERAQGCAGRLAVEGAHDFGRHSWRDVEDELRGGVGDEIDAQARAVDL